MKKTIMLIIISLITIISFSVQAEEFYGEEYLHEDIVADMLQEKEREAETALEEQKSQYEEEIEIMKEEYKTEKEKAEEETSRRTSGLYESIYILEIANLFYCYVIYKIEVEYNERSWFRITIQIIILLYAFVFVPLVY